jgi:hypothetical protein
MARSALIRSQPCPKCGSYMIWTENAWKEKSAGPGGDPATVPRHAAYVCENPVCGLVLDPAKSPREAQPTGTAGGPAGRQD